MGYINKIISLFTSSHNEKHIWNIRVGKKKYYVQEILNNYDLLGYNKLEINDFFEGYPFYEKSSAEYIYQIKKSNKGIYILSISFDQDKPVKVIYSYLQYKLS